MSRPDTGTVATIVAVAIVMIVVVAGVIEMIDGVEIGTAHLGKFSK